MLSCVHYLGTWYRGYHQPIFDYERLSLQSFDQQGSLVDSVDEVKDH